MAGARRPTFNNTTGSDNVALGYNAGSEATTGSCNVFLGSEVRGTVDDANTIRIGLPYDSGTGEGQHRTFVAGIHGTALTGPAVPVSVHAQGRLGTVTAPVMGGTIDAGVAGCASPALAPIPRTRDASFRCR
jgi:hypothetical protein